MKRKRGVNLTMVYLFLLPSLAIFLLYRVIPIGWNFVLSFQEWKVIGANEWVGFEHYMDMFRDEVFWQSFRNTLVYFFIGSPLAIVLAVTIATLVNNPMRGRNFYRVVVFLPYPITPVAIAIIWKWLYNKDVGLINYLLREIGLVDRGIPFLQSFTLALPSVIVTSVWQVLGYFVILVLAGLQTIPDDLYESAELDGASPMAQFFRITLPLIRPTVFICFIVGIINSFTVFDMVWVMTRGGPGHATEILMTNIYKNAFTFNKIGFAAAMTVFMFLFLLAVTWYLNRLSGGEAGGVEYYE
ncbi:MAG: sugar ABC transporter permease [Spirochaetota bacterium]|nr:sugar ABC transporter permease [Spirochaetota bacterium]